jgi:heme-degrading monooxygenase HmoA
MAYIFVKHKVADYNAWKSTFDAFIETRRAGGEKSFQILHPENEPNNLLLMFEWNSLENALLLMFEWNSLENARNFMTSEELKNAMKQAGVVEEPQIQFLNELDKGVV